MGNAMICRGKKVSDISRPTKKHFSHSQLTNISNENIREIYTFDKIIGKGSYGVVRQGYLKNDPSKKLAIKILEKDSLNNKIYILEREVMILQKLDHPNIIKFYETYQDKKYLYIVMEYCAGGELIHHIIQKNHLSEDEARAIMFKILSAINYMHKRKVVHRDLKPENVLFLDSSENSELKIIDFGLSNIAKVEGKDNILEESVNLHTRVGTPHYVAPEVLQGNYTFACDVWSLGVMMYFLLSGNPPFLSETEAGLFKKIEKGLITFEGKQWSVVSTHAKDLILRMIKVNPKKRLTCEQALHHPWFQKTKISKNKITNENSHDNILTSFDKNILNSLTNRKSTNILKREILKVLVNRLNSQEILNLRQAFADLDKDHQGIINSEELLKVMQIHGFAQSENEIRTIIRNITGGTDDSSLFLNYTDFITATMDLKKLFDKHRLWNLFKYFDVGNKDYITVEDLKDVMARGGKKIPVNELHRIIIENNLAKEGRINFDDFCKMLDIDEVNEIQSPLVERGRSRSLANN